MPLRSIRSMYSIFLFSIPPLLAGLSGDDLLRHYCLLLNYTVSHDSHNANNKMLNTIHFSSSPLRPFAPSPLRPPPSALSPGQSSAQVSPQPSAQVSPQPRSVLSPQPSALSPGFTGRGTSFFHRPGAGGRSAAGRSSIPIPSYTKTQNSLYFTRYTFSLLTGPRSVTLKRKRSER